MGREWAEIDGGVERLVGPEVDALVVDVRGGEEITRGGEGQAGGRAVHLEAVNRPVGKEEGRKEGEGESEGGREGGMEQGEELNIVHVALCKIYICKHQKRKLDNSQTVANMEYQVI